MLPAPLPRRRARSRGAISTHAPRSFLLGRAGLGHLEQRLLDPKVLEQRGGVGGDVCHRQVLDRAAEEDDGEEVGPDDDASIDFISRLMGSACSSSRRRRSGEAGEGTGNDADDHDGADEVAAEDAALEAMFEGDDGPLTLLTDVTDLLDGPDAFASEGNPEDEPEKACKVVMMMSLS